MAYVCAIAGQIGVAVARVGVVLCVVDIVKAALPKIISPFSIIHLPFFTGRRLVSQVEPHLTKIQGGALVHPFNRINLHIFPNPTSSSLPITSLSIPFEGDGWAVPCNSDWCGQTKRYQLNTWQGCHQTCKMSIYFEDGNWEKNITHKIHQVHRNHLA